MAAGGWAPSCPSVPGSWLWSKPLFSLPGCSHSLLSSPHSRPLLHPLGELPLAAKVIFPAAESALNPSEASIQLLPYRWSLFSSKATRDDLLNMAHLSSPVQAFTSTPPQMLPCNTPQTVLSALRQRLNIAFSGDLPELSLFSRPSQWRLLLVGFPI